MMYAWARIKERMVGFSFNGEDVEATLTVNGRERVLPSCMAEEYAYEYRHDLEWE